MWRLRKIITPEQAEKLQARNYIVSVTEETLEILMREVPSNLGEMRRNGGFVGGFLSGLIEQVAKDKVKQEAKSAS